MRFALHRGRREAVVVASTALLLIVPYVVLLLRNGKLRPAVLPFFLYRMLPIGAAHAVVLLLVHRYASRPFRADAGYWAWSAAAFLAFGGPRRAMALLALAVLTAGLVLVGRRLALTILPSESRGFGAELGLGVLALSFAGSVLAALGILTPVAVSLAVTSALIWAIRDVSLPACRECVRKASLAWSLREALAFELGFLLLLFAIVAATAPESRADAVTRYLPYVRSLLHYRGFFDAPWQFPWIVPQAGLTYASPLFLASPLIGRCAMLIALVAATAVAARGSGRGIGWFVALVLATSPIVVWTSVSLYQDTFVSLSVLLLAMVCCDAMNPGTWAFWLCCGGLAGMVWAAKYSAAGFAIPLLLWALWRGRAKGWPANVRRAAVFGSLGVLATSMPWMIHSWKESRNPVFPFFASVFPSPLWRKSFLEMLSPGFYLGKGIRQLLLWPVAMTFRTDRFVEGLPGNLGLVLLVYLALVAVSLRSATSRRRVWIASAVLGTALVWTRTAYVRYWLPGLWLLCPSAVAGARILCRKRAAGTVLLSFLAAIVLVQVPMAMIHAWNDPEGWPWAVYAGRITETDYVKAAPGAEAILRLNAMDRTWPRIWYTGFQAVGHADAVPIGAQTFEIGYHVPLERDAVRKYLQLPGCRYWAVREDMPSAELFRKSGFVDDWWLPKNLVVSDGVVSVYRSPSVPGGAAGAALEGAKP